MCPTEYCLRFIATRSFRLYGQDVLARLHSKEGMHQQLIESALVAWAPKTGDSLSCCKDFRCMSTTVYGPWMIVFVCVLMHTGYSIYLRFPLPGYAGLLRV
ncbi:hypothetical protein QFZ97_005606 [Paraburkholderia youngii]